MLISLNWIKDFVNLPDINVQDIANDFTMKTAEVEGVKLAGEHLSKIYVAKIISHKKHPEADKLNLVTVDYGKEQMEVVCGAPNVKDGLMIPYAPIGVTLPNGLTLEPKKIRGVLSQGMLCSAVELGLGEESSGLMELNPDSKVGKTLNEHFNTKPDVIIDVDNKSLTHRPDLWGVYGIAREFSAIYGEKLQAKFDESWKDKCESLFNSQTSPLKPVVDPESACKSFWGLSVDNVSVSESPAWIQERLLAVGLRPINSIVDISNYVMIELGMPLHIYDRESIVGDKIYISKAKQEMTFQTLDEVERKVLKTDTLISDSKQALVLAGVMGGLSSGVKESTTKVFIEVANWRAEEVRKTSTRLGLRTDSSVRYEKSLDDQMTYRTLLRTLDLLMELNPQAKVVGKPEYDGRDLKETRALIIDLSLEKVNRHLGTNLDHSKVQSILESLDFKVSLEKDTFKVIVPSYRATKDIEGAHDLIEEVGRIIGYGSIETHPPMTAVNPVNLSSYKKVERKVQDFFSTLGSSLEVMSYPLVGEKLLKKAKWSHLNTELKLVNALTNDADRMRPTLVGNLLEVASLNVKNFSDFSFFEWGRIYEPSKEFYKERNILGFVNYSKKESQFLKTLETSEKFLDFLGLNYQISQRKDSKHPCDLVPDTWQGVHPFECLDLIVRGKSLGVAFSVHPLLLRDFKIKGNLSILLLDLTTFCQSSLAKVHKYKHIPKFPASTFDCSVLMSHETLSAEALKVQKKLKNKDLVSVKIVDSFSLNDEQKSVTLRFTFQNLNATLSAQSIKSYEDSCVQELSKLGYPLKA